MCVGIDAMFAQERNSSKSVRYASLRMAVQGVWTQVVRIDATVARERNGRKSVRYVPLRMPVELLRHARERKLCIRIDAAFARERSGRKSSIVV